MQSLRNEGKITTFPHEGEPSELRAGRPALKEESKGIFRPKRELGRLGAKQATVIILGLLSWVPETAPEP